MRVSLNREYRLIGRPYRTALSPAPHSKMTLILKRASSAVLTWVWDFQTLGVVVIVSSMSGSMGTKSRCGRRSRLSTSVEFSAPKGDVESADPAGVPQRRCSATSRHGALLHGALLCVSPHAELVHLARRSGRLNAHSRSLWNPAIATSRDCRQTTANNCRLDNVPPVGRPRVIAPGNIRPPPYPHAARGRRRIPE